MFRKILPYLFVGLTFFVLGFYVCRSIKKPITSSALPQVTTKQEQTLSKSICDEVVDSEYLPVKKYEGKPAKVDFSSIPAASEYKTVITEQASEGPNYAGHYTVAGWGCGTDCVGYAIIDAISGKIVQYEPYNEEGNGLTYDINSKILIHNEEKDFDYYKGKTIDEINSENDNVYGKPREYFQLIEKSDDGYEWIDGEIWLKMICTENVLDGIVKVDDKVATQEASLGTPVIYYGYNSKISTSGEARFYWIDPDSGKIIDQNDLQAWFWAMPPEKVTDNDDLTAKWYEFIHENIDSTFKIIGTRGEDDYDYWGDWITNKCMQNIDIQSIEVVGSNKRMNF